MMISLEEELKHLSTLRRVWDSDSSENLTPGLIQLCRDWLCPEHLLAEIGCYAGVSTAIFACFVKKVIAVDPFTLASEYNQIPPEMLQQAEQRFAEVRQRFPNITHIRSRSVDAARQIEDHSLDAVYIDGWHTPEAFTVDVRSWQPKLRPGGLLMGHDWGQIEGCYAGLRLPPLQAHYAEDSWVTRVNLVE